MHKAIAAVDQCGCAWHDAAEVQSTEGSNGNQQSPAFGFSTVLLSCELAGGSWWLLAAANLTPANKLPPVMAICI